MIAIVADDLSGACDTAVKLCGTGRSIQVLMVPSKSVLPASGRNLVLALTTNSRAMAAQDAYRCVYEVASRLKHRAWSLVYKKVDSMLRGNTGVEILALLDALEYDLVVLTPAVPDNHRLVLHGKLVSSEQSEDGLAALDRLQADGLRPGTVSVEVLQQGAEKTAQAIAACYKNGCNVVLLDGANEMHLRVAAEAMKRLPLRVLPAGAAGLLPYLAESEKQTADCPQHMSLRGCRTLVVAGSSHPTTKSQIQRLMQQENTGCVCVDVAHCLHGNREAEIARCTDQAELVMRSGVQTLVLAVSSLFEAGGERKETTNGEISAPLIVNVIARLTRRIVSAYGFDVLFMMGGETAYHVLEELHTSSMEILYEFVPGVPVNRVCLDGKQIMVVTKSGGFGEESTITDFIDSVQQNCHADMAMEGA